MKDLEKIKSEDLGCQVQDANPGNFAIEQEVAQLVGATVPAPTEPSADDARELGAQLSVFLRRALTPIQSALRTALAAIYAYLDSRCTDYTPAAYDPFRLPAGPYDPMRPFVPRTLPNLLTAITAFSARKISNGSAQNDGIPDGVSLAHLMNDPSVVTKLYDDNPGWVLTYNPVSKFPNITLFQSNAQRIAFSVELTGNMFTGASLRELDMPLLERAENTLQSVYQVCYHGVFAFSELERVNLPKLNYINGCLFRSCTLPNEVTLPELVTATRGLLDSVSGIKRISAPKLTTCNGYSYYPNVLGDCPDLEYAYIPNLTNMTWYGTTGAGGTLQNMPKLEELHIGKVAFTSNSWNTVFLTGCDALIKLVIYGDLNQNLYLNSWNPTDKGTTFLQNFREHIALRLTSNGRGLTLTLSQAVRNAIHAAEATYGIEAIIVTQKGWTLSPAPGASSQ